VVRRDYVESRNAQPNNEFWIINEEKSAKLDGMRQEQADKRAADEKLKNVSPAEMLGSIAKGLENIAESKGNSEKADLQAELDEMGIPYDKRMGTKKLKELIEKNK
jgi:hypothetical protein